MAKLTRKSFIVCLYIDNFLNTSFSVFFFIWILLITYTDTCIYLHIYDGNYVFIQWLPYFYFCLYLENVLGKDTKFYVNKQYRVCENVFVLFVKEQGKKIRYFRGNSANIVSSTLAHLSGFED